MKKARVKNSQGRGKRKSLKAAAFAVAAGVWLASMSARGVSLSTSSKVRVELYGEVKLDAVYQNAYALLEDFPNLVPPGNLVGWPPRDAHKDEQRNREQDSFSMTARRTMLGLEVGSPEEGGLSAKARVEADFFGPAPRSSAALNQDPEGNRGNFSLRRAYVEAGGESWAVLAGQEWMVISPLHPHVASYPYGGNAGNLGWFMPQVRFTGFALDKKLRLEAAAVALAGDVDSLFEDTGRMSGSPGWQFGISFDGPVFAAVTGHTGMEEVQTVRGGEFGYNGSRVGTWSWNVSLLVPVGEVFAFSGEYFQGANLDGWLNGSQAAGWVVDKKGNRKPVRSQGGWFEFMIKPAPILAFYLGYGIDDPEDRDLRGSTIEGEPGAALYFNGDGDLAPTKNRMFYGSAKINLTSRAGLTLEWMQAITDYENARKNQPKLHYEPGKADRYTVSFSYAF